MFIDSLAGTAHPVNPVTTTVVDVSKARPVLLGQVIQNPPERLYGGRLPWRQYSWFHRRPGRHSARSVVVERKGFPGAPDESGARLKSDAA